MLFIDEAIADFHTKFDSEEACYDVVERMKWPNGFQCPSCQYRFAYRIVTRRLPLFECAQCGAQTSLTANTIMHRSKTELRKWLFAMYVVATVPYSVNAVKLASLLDVTYKTAWRILHSIRISISWAEDAQLLSGHIEAKHELFMEDMMMSDTRMEKEQSLIIAREWGINELPRYRMKLIVEKRFARTPLSERHAYDFVSKSCGDQFLTFAMNPRSQFSRISSVFEQAEHNKRVHLISFGLSIAMIEQQRQSVRNSHSPSLSEVAKEAFYWINSSFNGVGPKYAQHYLDEFCFRINRVNCSDDKKFEQLIKAVVHLSVKHSFDNSDASLFRTSA